MNCLLAEALAWLPAAGPRERKLEGATLQKLHFYLLITPFPPLLPYFGHDVSNSIHIWGNRSVVLVEGIGSWCDRERALRIHCPEYELSVLLFSDSRFPTPSSKFGTSHGLLQTNWIISDGNYTWFLQIAFSQPGVVINTCNPSFLGGRGRRITSWSPAWAKVVRPSLKNQKLEGMGV
jgi:hypothetical protein